MADITCSIIMAELDIVPFLLVHSMTNSFVFSWAFLRDSSPAKKPIFSSSLMGLVWATCYITRRDDEGKRIESDAKIISLSLGCKARRKHHNGYLKKMHQMTS